MLIYILEVSMLVASSVKPPCHVVFTTCYSLRHKIPMKAFSKNLFVNLLKVQESSESGKCRFNFTYVVN